MFTHLSTINLLTLSQDIRSEIQDRHQRDEVMAALTQQLEYDFHEALATKEQQGKEQQGKEQQGKEQQGKEQEGKEQEACPVQDVSLKLVNNYTASTLDQTTAPRRRQPKPFINTTIYVTGLPTWTTEEGLADFFAGCGEIIRTKVVYWPRRRDSGLQCKGFAYIRFKDVIGSNNALRLDNQPFEHCFLKVQYNRQRRRQ